MSRLILLLAAALIAPQATQVEITNEPHHHLVFENQDVRVFNVQVDPNTETQIHWHRHDYIAVTLGPAEIANTVLDKPPATTKLTDGDVRFASATFAHSVRDVGPDPFRNVTVEILKDATLRTMPSPWDKDKDKDKDTKQDSKKDSQISDPVKNKNDARALEVLPHGTAQILFVKDAIRATDFELQPGGSIPAHSPAHPLLLIAVTAFDLSTDSGAKPHHFNAGDSLWLPNGLSRPITNTAHESAKFVTLEFP
jgi:quercetin dioxygenase-like cupin family protein